MEKGSVARDTLAVCFAAVLFVALSLGGLLLLSPIAPQPRHGGQPLRTVDSAGVTILTPVYIS